VVWDLAHENEIIQPWGTSRARSVRRAGREIACALAHPAAT
jgi:hypothetical protein